MNTTTHGVTTYWLAERRAHPVLCALASVVPDLPYVAAMLVGLARAAPAIVGAIAGHGSLRAPLFAALTATWASPFWNFLAQKILHNLVLSAALGVVAIATRRPRLQAIALGWTLHVVADFSLHVNDAYSVLWPFTRRVFPAPISYWDPEHHGAIVGGTLALIAAALWALSARRLWIRGAPGRLGRFRVLLAAGCAALALASATGVLFGPAERAALPGEWIDDGIEWPAELAPIARIAARSPEAALAGLRGLPAASDEPGRLPWELHAGTARRALLEGYALDLAGHRQAAIEAYGRAEQLEPVGNVGDKARRYEAEPFRDVRDPPLSREWLVILLGALGSAFVQWRRLPVVEGEPDPAVLAVDAPRAGQ